MPELDPFLKQFEGVPLTNIILSSNPCPTCVKAEGRTMTLKEWRNSEFGVPGSHRRICNGYCHCILVTEEMKQEMIDAGLDAKVPLRGDPGTDVGKVIEIGPNEQLLSDLMDRYNSEIGRLPDEFYRQPFENKASWLKGALKEGKK